MLTRHVKFSLRDLESYKPMRVGLSLIIDPPPDYRGDYEVRHVNKYNIAQGHLFASISVHAGKRTICKRVTSNTHAQ